jgi:hypothetical protein
LQYVGETSQTLQERINGHKSGIRQGQTEEYKHFRSDERHSNTEVNDLLKIQIAEKVFS